MSQEKKTTETEIKETTKETDSEGPAVKAPDEDEKDDKGAS